MKNTNDSTFNNYPNYKSNDRYGQVFLVEFNEIPLKFVALLP